MLNWNVRSLSKFLLVVCLGYAHTSYGTVDVEEIAQALVQTSKGGNPDYQGGPPSKELKDAQFVMRVNYTNLHLISKYGFLNQYQSKSSNGSFHHSGRNVTESTMVGLNLPIEPKTLKPKYGTLHMDRADGQSFLYSSDLYGDVVFVFGRHLLPRMTWSPNDSLYSGDSVRPINSAEHLPNSISSYPEAQVWGDLDLSDVDMIVVDSYVKNSARQDVLNFAKANSLDVFYSEGRVGENNRILRREELSPLLVAKSPRVNTGTRYLFNSESIRREIKDVEEWQLRESAPLLHWLSVLWPEMIPSGGSWSIKRSSWHDVYGARGEYSDDPGLEFREARENTVKGLRHMYTHAGNRHPLKAAIIRYFRKHDWISAAHKKEMEKLLKNDSGKTSILKWIAIWEERSRPIHPTPISSRTSKNKKDAESDVESTDKLFETVDTLIGKIHQGGSERIRRLALGKLSKILEHDEYKYIIAEEFADSRRFAQVVYGHGADFDRDFIKAYRKALKRLVDRSASQEKVFAACALWLKAK